MKLTVLHVIPSFSGGGAELQLVRLAGGLSAAGVDVHIAYLHEGPNFEAALQSGATLHRLNCASNYDPRVIFDLCRVMAKIRPAVVQTWLLHADVFGGIAARWSGVPWVLSERSSAEMYRNGVKFMLRRLIGCYSDVVVANSQGGLSYWQAAGHKGPGYLIRNIVRLPPSNITKECCKAKSPRVLAIGRLSEEKNYPLLFNALEILFKRIPEVRATILGEGPERSRLQERFSGSVVLNGRIDLPGHVQNVADWLAESTVYVSLSRFEGTPNTVIEAIMNGCPLVLSDISAHRELLTEDEASFVPLNSSIAIADALYLQLTKPHVTCERVRLARSRLSDWSMERITEQYLVIYRNLNKRSSVCV